LSIGAVEIGFADRRAFDLHLLRNGCRTGAEVCDGRRRDAGDRARSSTVALDRGTVEDGLRWSGSEDFNWHNDNGSRFHRSLDRGG